MTDEDEARWAEVVGLINGTGDEFRLTWWRKAPPSDAMIADAEEALEIRFPDQYRRFLAGFGAIYLDVDEATWRRPGPYEVRPSWQMGHGRIVTGVAAGLHPDLSVVAQTVALRERGIDGFVPVVREVTGTGSWIGFDDAGVLCEWSHEDAGLRPVGGQLADVVLEHLQRLVDDRARLVDQPIAPAPARPMTWARAHTLTLTHRLEPAALQAALQEGLAALRRGHQVEARDPATLEELVAGDRVVPVFGVDDAVELQLSRMADTLNVSVLADPRVVPLAAEILEIVDREVSSRGEVTARTRNWERW